MPDLDQIALDTVEAIANIDPDKLKGGRVQAMARAQCLVRDALRGVEAERDVALEQVIYWRERAVGAEAERYALTAHVERLRSELRDRAVQAWCGCEHPACKRCRDDMETERVLAELPTSSLARVRGEVRRQVAEEWELGIPRLKAEWQAEAVETAVVRGYRSRDELAGWAEHLRRQAEETSHGR